MNLLFKDFANEFPWLRDTYKKGKAIVKYVKNHQSSLAMFRTYSHLELLKVAQTRCASQYILLKRPLDCREALITLVCQKKWKEWVKKGDEQSRKLGAEVAENVKNDNFWDEVENIVTILKPLYHVLRFADGEGPRMGEIYEKMDNMSGEVQDTMASNRYFHDFSKMEQLITKRWEKMNVPIHCVGFALNPRFYDANYLKSPAPGGVSRKAPNLDKEVVTGLMKSLEKLANNPLEESKLRDQFATFYMKKEIFGTKAAQVDSVTMDAITWWSTYGCETPELAVIAIKILSQPISSSSAERNWSTYKFIHSVIRNKLNNIRADKLVFIHENLRLISRFTSDYNSGEFKGWDIEPDNPTLEDSSIRLLELTWESLDDANPFQSLSKGKEIACSS
ncbi:hypothetical protein RND81_09G110000 [Saponaria officinalis]|uniref:HAT C-terminal dimerisation domain-containing protein n=1 Tax=Saponaria officinalis TaxID=3572 RepID=A0AAW1ILC2_SAPOF